MQLELQKDIRPQANNKGLEIRLIKTALNRLGYYFPDSQNGITDDDDPSLYEAIKDFQKDKLISVSGMVLRGDRTEAAINRALDDQENRSQSFTRRYVWRTVGDGKVRGEHASRAGRIFLWDRPPDGGHPGEDYNCRCWAEPLVPLTSKGLKVGQLDLINPVPLDEINPTLSPLDFIGGGGVGVKIVVKNLVNKMSKTSYKKISSLTKDLSQYLGKDFKTITNKYGDKIFISKDGNKRVRFDINNSQGDVPHAHIERKVKSGKWKDSTSQHRIRFKK